jgi:predicted nucleotidyltransferase
LIIREDKDKVGAAMNTYDVIVRSILEHYPTAQAIYLFGTYGTADEWPDSDVDIAVLLAPQQAKAAGSLALSALRFELEASLKKEVDLINLRRVPTVLQKEVIAADRRIYQADEYAADEFEMLTLSYYQKLNEERAEIVEDALATGRFII